MYGSVNKGTNCKSGFLTFQLLLLILICLSPCNNQKQDDSNDFRDIASTYTQETTHVIIPIRLNSNKLPIVSIVDLCSQEAVGQIGQVSLLVDTGSEQLCISDERCQDCAQTVQICSHLKNPTQKLNYLSNQIMGDYSYFTLCETRYLFFCILKASRPFSIHGTGILGLKGNSTGHNFMTKLLSKKYQNIVQNTLLSISYGRFESSLVLGEIPKIMYKQILASNISLNISQANAIYFGDQQLTKSKQTFPYKVSFDSGSSVILLPSKVYELFLKKLNNTLQFKCAQESTTLPMIICQKWTAFNLKPISLELNINPAGKKLNLTLNPKSYISLNPNSLHKYTIKIINQTVPELQNRIILGQSIFQEYLLQFNLKEDLISIYEYNTLQTDKLHIKNVHFFTFMYVLAVLALSVLIIKLLNSLQLNKKQY